MVYLMSIQEQVIRVILPVAVPQLRGGESRFRARRVHAGRARTRHSHLEVVQQNSWIFIPVLEVAESTAKFCVISSNRHKETRPSPRTSACPFPPGPFMRTNSQRAAAPAPRPSSPNDMRCATFVDSDDCCGHSGRTWEGTGSTPQRTNGNIHL